MSTPLTDEQLQGIDEQLAAAEEELYAISEGTRRFTKSTPAKLKTDSDLIFADAFAGAGQLLAEVERLRAERQRAIDALDKPGRDAVATSGDLEDGITMDRLHLKAERPEPPEWAAVHDVLAEHRFGPLTTATFTDLVMGLFGGDA